MKFDTFLSTISEKPLRVLDASISLNTYAKIDLSVHNKTLEAIEISSARHCETYITNYLNSLNAEVAYGGYLEERNLYNSSENFIGTEERTIHLGIDLWCKSGTKILAVLDGELHSFQNNNNLGNYGPTIILKHAIKEAEFYSLYGHLSLESLKELEVGQKVSQGEAIATLGSAEINGGYAPHLHFQLIKDIQGMFGDYAGVCSKQDLEFYKENCPDPNLLLKLSYQS